jgi:integrase
VNLPDLASSNHHFGRLLELADAFATTYPRANTRAAYRVDLYGCGYPIGQCIHPKPEKIHNLDAYLWWCYRSRVNPLACEAADVELWLAALADTQAEGTRARRLAVVSSWYAWLVRQRALAADDNPITRMDPRKKPKRRKPGTFGTALALEQATAALAVADRDGPRSSALIAIALICGLRESEIVGLDLEDLTAGMHGPGANLEGKGGKHRWVPFPPKVASRVAGYRAARPPLERLPATSPGSRPRRPLFVTRNGGRLDRHYVYRLIRRITARAGIPDGVMPHDLRRTFASQSLEAGVPLSDVQDAMGHAMPVTTRGYDRRSDNPARHPAHRIASLLEEVREDGNHAA